MAVAKSLPLPQRWINGYLRSELSKYADIGVSENTLLDPFIASMPTNIDELYNNFIQISGVQEPVIFQYDRLLRLRRNSFYPIKKEQTMYYFYSTKWENIMGVNLVISQLLDREDAAAQDVNKWSVDKQNSSTPLTFEQIDENGNKTVEKLPFNVYFHNIRVYQADETRDVLELSSARTLFRNKLIIEYDYHIDWDQTTLPSGSKYN